MSKGLGENPPPTRLYSRRVMMFLEKICFGIKRFFRNWEISAARRENIPGATGVPLDKIVSCAAKIRGVCRSAFRAGELSEIIGVEVVTPIGMEPRPCFKCKYEDGFIDFIPICDVFNNHGIMLYKIES